jgi:hypothetical protein
MFYTLYVIKFFNTKDYNIVLLDGFQLKNHLFCFTGIVMPTLFYFIEYY